MRHQQLALALTAALALSACATSDDAAPDVAAPTTETVTETETATQEASLALTQDCESDRWATSIPDGWWANDQRTTDRGDGIPACAFVHPTAQDELEGESLHHAARIYVDQVAYADATAEADGRTTTVAGRDATVYERESDGDGLVPEGERSYVYVVDLGDGESLLAVTHSVGDTDYERDKELLDRMMGELELTG